MRDHLLVAKPWIVLANVMSAAGGFFLASRGRIDPELLVAVLAGIACVVASACVCNNCIDRELDRKMARTRHRALARGALSVRVAWAQAAVLGLAGLTLLWAFANTLCAAVILGGFVVYVGVYSLFLKRNSVHSTIIGSLAGAAPPVGAYCAVTGRFDTGAVILLFIFGLWQIPHSYAIGIFHLDDYSDAEIPVVPVKLGKRTAKRHIAFYIPAFVVAAQMLTFSGYTGYGYLVSATVLGLYWLYMARPGGADSDERAWARKVAAFSILVIVVLSAMMSIDFTTPL